MKKLMLASIGVLALGAGSLLAHHSYPTFYDLQQTVTLKGKVSEISFKDPHVMLTIETKSSGTWKVECTSVMGLMRQGIVENTIRVGDFLEIEASPSRNPDARVVSALREIRRPADGSRWTSNARLPNPRVIE